jgi:EvpB/VC_A0108, tail sheath N-terminal domain
VNELNLAADLPAKPSPPVGAPEAGAAPVRDVMLSGQFIGSRDQALADSVAGFLGGEAGEAIDRWFGAERGALLRIDPQALRDAVDRDIAAIDMMLSEQVDAILHHARLRKLEGTWRGVAWLVDNSDLSNRLKLKLLNVGRVRSKPAFPQGL